MQFKTLSALDIDSISALRVEGIRKGLSYVAIINAILMDYELRSVKRSGGHMSCHESKSRYYSCFLAIRSVGR